MGAGSGDEPIRAEGEFGQGPALGQLKTASAGPGSGVQPIKNNFLMSRGQGGEKAGVREVQREGVCYSANQERFSERGGIWSGANGEQARLTAFLPIGRELSAGIQC